MATDLLVVFMFFVAAAGFVFLMLSIGRLLRPHNPSPDKNEIYECGERPIGAAWIQFNPRFYIIALIFLIFDVEVAFIFPVGAVFRKLIAEGQGALAFIELFVFMGLLLLGLVYVWTKGDLQWLKQIKPQA